MQQQHWNLTAHSTDTQHHQKCWQKRSCKRILHSLCMTETPAISELFHVYIHNVMWSRHWMCINATEKDVNTYVSSVWMCDLSEFTYLTKHSSLLPFWSFAKEDGHMAIESWAVSSKLSLRARLDFMSLPWTCHICTCLTLFTYIYVVFFFWWGWVGWGLPRLTSLASTVCCSGHGFDLGSVLTQQCLLLCLKNYAETPTPSINMQNLYAFRYTCKKKKSRLL